MTEPQPRHLPRHRRPWHWPFSHPAGTEPDLARWFASDAGAVGLWIQPVTVVPRNLGGDPEDPASPA